MKGSITINGVVRAVVSLVACIAAVVFLLRDLWPLALLTMLAAWLLDGLLAHMAFAQPDDES
jgi:hypothetical protein